MRNRQQSQIFELYGLWTEDFALLQKNQEKPHLKLRVYQRQFNMKHHKTVFKLLTREKKKDISLAAAEHEDAWGKRWTLSKCGTSPRSTSVFSTEPDAESKIQPILTPGSLTAAFVRRALTVGALSPHHSIPWSTINPLVAIIDVPSPHFSVSWQCANWDFWQASSLFLRLNEGIVCWRLVKFRHKWSCLT